MSTKVRNTVYELKRKNPITLGDDSNIEANLKPIKIDSKNSILELSENELKVRGTIDASAITVDGASVQTGTDAGATQLNELSDVIYSFGVLTIDSLDEIVALLQEEMTGFREDMKKYFGSWGTVFPEFQKSTQNALENAS